MITGHMSPQGNTSKTQVLHPILHIRIKFPRVLHKNTYQRPPVAPYCICKFSLDPWPLARDYISHSPLQ